MKDIASGLPWREVSAAVFGREGSMGKGAAMREAPIGAYFTDDLEIAIAAARTSALPTHANSDAQAGAIAVAVAAALAWQMREAPDGECQGTPKRSARDTQTDRPIHQVP